MRNALVLSPFATWPADAGQRRRALQSTQALKDMGYRITFLFYAFEGGWYWRYDEAAYDEMRRQWDEVVIYPANGKVGQPPKDGQYHQLDEWWEPDLEVLLHSLFRRRFFDVMVVHNVWLSKALDFAPPATIKVLETHDIFSRRQEIYARLEISAEFFNPQQATEYFGLGRADIILTIQELEAVELLPKFGAKVLNLPFLTQAVPKARTDYLAADRVTFGFLGSAHIFNILGLRALIAELEPLIADTFAPVDLVIGGDVGTKVESRLPIRRLGYVKNEDEFFEQVDICIAPVFDGSGFKVKVADIVARHFPLLVAEHAALGMDIAQEVICADARAMAQAIVGIALRRPQLQGYRDACAVAQRNHVTKTNRALAYFKRRLIESAPPMVLDLQFPAASTSLAMLVSYACLARVLGGQRKTYVLVEPQVVDLFDNVAAIGVRVVTGDNAMEIRAIERKLVVRPTVAGTPIDTSSPLTIVIDDPRWTAEAIVTPPAAGHSMAFAPFLHGDIQWDPAVSAVIRGLVPADNFDWNSQTRIIFALANEAAFLGALFTERLGLGNARIFRVDDIDSLNAGVAAVLRRAKNPTEVIWYAGRHPMGGFIFEACKHMGLPFSGVINGCVSRSTEAPAGFSRSLQAIGGYLTGLSAHD